jgi:hypothetical protein
VDHASEVKGVLKTRPKIGSTFPIFLLEGNQMNGYDVESTTQMPANTLIFGDYSTVILGEWGILEIEANKYGSSFGSRWYSGSRSAHGGRCRSLPAGTQETDGVRLKFDNRQPVSV